MTLFSTSKHPSVQHKTPIMQPDKANSCPKKANHTIHSIFENQFIKALQNSIPINPFSALHFLPCGASCVEPRDHVKVFSVSRFYNQYLLLQKPPMHFFKAAAWLPLLAGALSYSIKSGLVSVNGNKAFDIEPKSDTVHRVTLDSVRDKLALTVELKGAETQPHQLNYVFSNDAGLDHAIFPKFDAKKHTVSLLLLVNKIPAALLQDRVFVYLVAASEQKKGNLYTLIGELIPTEALQSSVNYEAPERLGAQPEIHHIFNEDPKTVNPVVPLAFSGVAIALFLGLVGAWFSVVGNSLFVANQGIPFKGGFLTTLALFEFTFFRYYLSASIFTTIFSVAALTAPALIFGARALKSLTKQRTIVEAST